MRVVLCGLLMLVSGCFWRIKTSASVMQSWVGHDATDVVSKWGVPDRTIDLAEGKKAFTWVVISTSDPAAGHVVGKITECRRTLTFAADGKVIAWALSPDCPSIGRP